MNLEEFIAETLSQIALGIQKAEEKLKDSNAFINPRKIIPESRQEHKIYGYFDERSESSHHRIVESIEFDVALTVTTGKETKGGIGVMVGSIGLGSQGKSETENSSLSRIKFTIPMVLPNPERSNKA